MMLVSEKMSPSKVQADGAFTILTRDVANAGAIGNIYQISLVPGTATAGTLAVSFKAFGSVINEALLDDSGTAVVLNAASPKTYTFQGNINSLTFTPTSMNGTYNVAVSSWG